MVSDLNSTGTTGTVFAGGNMSARVDLAIDASSKSRALTPATSTSPRISSADTLSNYTGTGIATPTAIALNQKY